MTAELSMRIWRGGKYVSDAFDSVLRVPRLKCNQASERGERQLVMLLRAGETIACSSGGVEMKSFACGE